MGLRKSALSQFSGEGIKFDLFYSDQYPLCFFLRCKDTAASDDLPLDGDYKKIRNLLENLKMGQFDRKCGAFSDLRIDKNLPFMQLDNFLS